MKTSQQLNDFYHSDLLPNLTILERKRRAICKKLFIVTVALMCIFAIVFFLFRSVFLNEPPMLFFPFVIMILIVAAIFYLLSREYIREFKGTVIQQIIHFVDEDLSYSHKGYIPKLTFMASEIFKTKPNRYKGDDLVSGKIGGTKITFSELNAVYESGSGKNRSRHTVFKGLFFVGDFNKHFTSRTVVLPDTAEKLFGGFGKMLQSLNFVRDKLIKLEDPEFERYFAVYGNDQIEARYILSTSLMQRIVDFKRKTGNNIYISFVVSNIYVAISYTRNLFEPRIFKTLLDFAPVQEYFEDIQLAIGIVEDLNLNTRIWSKS